MLAYNLLKYYIILLKNFKNSLLNKNELNALYPNLKWADFLVTKEFKELSKEIDDDLAQN
jgi:hypothetical protein